jgi:hypothetical protein
MPAAIAFFKLTKLLYLLFKKSANSLSNKDVFYNYRAKFFKIKTLDLCR